MYEIPEEIRKVFESLMIPFTFLQYEDGITFPVLVSEGMLSFMKVSRQQISQYSSDGLNGNMFEKVFPDDASRLQAMIDGFVKGENECDILFRAKREDGYHNIHAVGRWQPLPDGNKIAMMTYADMSEHEEVVSEIAEHYSLFQKDDFYTDALTNLPNLNYFNKYCEDRATAIRMQGKKPVIMYYDLDSMQSYNTGYGTQKGDELLALVARVLCEEFPDAQVTRSADDHFVVLDKFTSEEKLIEIVEKVNQRVKSEAFGNTTGTHVGICVMEQHISAKEALDHAKLSNKMLGQNLNNCYRFFSIMDNFEYLGERYIIENFYKALNNGYINVHYQGLMRVESGKGYGFECLARWQDPDRGIIMPKDFIPALEKYHLMHDLDIFMFEQVCREIPLRQEAGLTLLPLSINFSRQDFDYIDVVGELNRIYDKYEIEKYGIDKSNFMIEITEQDMATATDSFNKQLKDIRKSGFKLWIDDFGSGYSSLDVFSRFDIDLIKFDMELLKNLDKHNGANRVLLKAMIEVAHKLGIHTLCEGLENNQQLEFLKEAGCEFAQGFYYHKPISLEKVFMKDNISVIIPKWETTEERKALEEAWNKKNLEEK